MATKSACGWVHLLQCTAPLVRQNSAKIWREPRLCANAEPMGSAGNRDGDEKVVPNRCRCAVLGNRGDDRWARAARSDGRALRFFLSAWGSWFCKYESVLRPLHSG